MGICVAVWETFSDSDWNFQGLGFFFFFLNTFQSSVITADWEEEIHSGQPNDPFHGKSSG